MEIGERIRKQRKAIRLRQDELAASVGMSTKSIQRWEYGERPPHADVIPQLAEALHTTVAYLMGLEDAPAPGQESPEPPSKEPEKEPPATPETDGRGTLSYTFENGEKLEVPATPEYAALFERMVTQRLNGQGAEIQAM